MGIIFDIIIATILLSSIYLGYKKGLMNVGFNLFATIISILVTVILYSPTTHLIIDNTEIDEKLEELIIQNGKADIIQSDNTNNEINIYIQNYAQNIVQGAQNAAVETIARTIAVNAVSAVVMVGLFIITRLVLIFIKTFTNAITKIPLIKQCNEIAGIVYGILRGLIIVYAILAVAFFLESLGESNSIGIIIQNTYITKFFYNNNLILKLLF